MTHTKYKAYIFILLIRTNYWAGVTGYSVDSTQGPACAVACAAGTVYRNYFVSVAGSKEDTRGQRHDSQINNLADLERMLSNEVMRFWTVRNGYTFSSEEALARLAIVLSEWESLHNRDDLLGKIRVGLHTDVGVTFARRFKEVDPTRPVLVSQVYCSALSCTYSGISTMHWRPLAKIVLDACYEATILAAILNRKKGGAKDVFLTFIGGGVFGNEPEWITNAISRAITIASRYNTDINIVICHFRWEDKYIKGLIDESVKRAHRVDEAC